MSKYSVSHPEDLAANLGRMYEYVPTGATILDVGCSAGYFGKLLIDHKQAKVDGIEIDRDDAREAAEVLRKVYSFDLDDDWPAELLKRRYDLIFFGDVLEHLKDSTRTLKMARKLLTPGGQVYISIPNIGHISTRLDLLRGNFIYESLGILDNTHLKYFTIETARKMIHEAGFKVMQFDYTLKDYPKETILKLLGMAHLTPQPAFWSDIVDSTQARAFQMRFMVEPGESKDEPLPKKGDEYRDNGVIMIENERDRLRVELAAAQQETARLGQELSDIVNSKTWKWALKLKRIVQPTLKP